MKVYQYICVDMQNTYYYYLFLSQIECSKNFRQLHAWVFKSFIHSISIAFMYRVVGLAPAYATLFIVSSTVKNRNDEISNASVNMHYV